MTLYAVFQSGEFVQAFESEYAAYDFIDCNIDCMRADFAEQWDRYRIYEYTPCGDAIVPRPR